MHSNEKGFSESERKQLLLGAEEAQTKLGGTAGAEFLFGKDGLHPYWWSLSKKQFAECVAEVRAAQAAGEITNPYGDDPTHPFYYDPSIFNDEKRGPNMHLINRDFIRPRTEVTTLALEVRDIKTGKATTKIITLPCLPYAFEKNSRTAGLPCDLFLSHAWDEPFYEFAERALTEWPADCRGAYICSLCNPQNLNIGALLGSDVSDSPFYRILHSPIGPRELLMVGNSITPIHGRLWCVLEAHEGHRASIQRISIAGPPHYLLTGEHSSQFKAETDAAVQEAETASQDAAALIAQNDINGQEKLAKLAELQQIVDAANQRGLQAQARV